MKNIIRQLIPLNILEERERFFQSETSNPQFIYDHTFTPEMLTAWGIPIPELVRHAQTMLAEHPATLDAHPSYVSETYIQEKIDHYNRAYTPPTPLQVVFSANQVVRCRIEETHIYFQTPIRYTAERFDDLYRHELETHALRRLNNQRQPWSGEDVNEVTFRRTEEGLANLHTFLLRQNKILRKSYITYLAVALAQQGSFRDVYTAMLAQSILPATAWNIALRTKRGLTDTAQPGGLTKDVCYLEGTIQVWEWLMNEAHDPRDLYLGRISLPQIAERTAQAVREGMRYPTFFDDLVDYRANVAEIGELNHFHSLVPFVSTP